MGEDRYDHRRAHGLGNKGRGAAAGESPADRIPSCYLPFRDRGPHRGIPPGSARAWVRGGKNIVIERRYAEGKLDHLPALAAELVHLKVDIIVATGPVLTRTAKEATSTIPIVMTFDPDPVGSGFVASLARPGGNITGLSTLSPELSGKQLELLKETVTKLFPCRRLWEFDQAGQRAGVKRDGTRRWGNRCAPSITGPTRSQGY
jgi:hypothetical protein